MRLRVKECVQFLTKMKLWPKAGSNPVSDSAHGTVSAFPTGWKGSQVEKALIAFDKCHGMPAASVFMVGQQLHRCAL